VYAIFFSFQLHLDRGADADGHAPPTQEFDTLPSTDAGTAWT
jgi:hypothetical protein